MQTTRTTRRIAGLLTALVGTGVMAFGPIAPASAEIGDLVSCEDPNDEFGGSLCEHPEQPEPELPEAQPEPEGDGGEVPDPELPEADVDGTVVADPNFTG